MRDDQAPDRFKQAALDAFERAMEAGEARGVGHPHDFDAEAEAEALAELYAADSAERIAQLEESNAMIEDIARHTAEDNKRLRAELAAAKRADRGSDDLSAKARQRIADRDAARAEMTSYENADELLEHLGIDASKPADRSEGSE